MKAQTIYNIAMAIMDEYKDNGGVDTSSTKDYLARTPSLLTLIATDIAMYIRKLDKGYEMPSEVKSISSNVELEDEICLGVMPYALAGHLLANEDLELGNYFMSLFSSKLENYSSDYRKMGKIVAREDLYNSSCRVQD